MGYFSDPTADMALGSINREFSRLEKRAKKLCDLYYKGAITKEALEKAQGEFTGLYSHLLKNALANPKKQNS